MISCPMLKVLTAVLGLAAVGVAADASALSGPMRGAMAKPPQAAPLLELARSQVRDHRSNPTPGKTIHPKDYQKQPKTPPPKGGSSPWKKKYPSNF